MASKSTPSFDRLIAARGGKGATAPAPGGKKMPMKAPPKGGKTVRDTDKHGN